MGVVKRSRQSYYRWQKQQVTESVLVETRRANALFDATRMIPNSGIDSLSVKRKASGPCMSERTEWQICRDN